MLLKVITQGEVDRIVGDMVKMSEEGMVINII